MDEAPAPYRPPALRHDIRLGRPQGGQQHQNHVQLSFIPGPSCVDDSGEWSRIVPEGAAVYTYGKSTVVHVDCHTLSFRRQIERGERDANVWEDH